MNSGVYKIICVPTGKFYIGSASDIQARFLTHKSQLQRGIHHSIKLQRAWSKYGMDAFSFEILLVCSKLSLLLYEQLIMDGMRAVETGFNICPVAGSRLGAIFTDAHKANLSAALKGRKGRPITPEQRKKMQLARLGVRHSDEHRMNISTANKGRKKTEAHKEKLRGRIFSDEHRMRLSIAATGRKIPGRKLTEEHKRKISDAHKARKRA